MPKYISNFITSWYCNTENVYGHFSNHISITQSWVTLQNNGSHLMSACFNTILWTSFLQCKQLRTVLALTVSWICTRSTECSLTGCSYIDRTERACVECIYIFPYACISHFDCWLRLSALVFYLFGIDIKYTVWYNKYINLQISQQLSIGGFGSREPSEAAGNVDLWQLENTIEMYRTEIRNSDHGCIGWQRDIVTGVGLFEETRFLVCKFD